MTMDIRSSGGVNNPDPTPHKIATAVENLTAFTHDHAMTKNMAGSTWHDSHIPHETKLALANSDAMPAQPNVYR